MALLASAPGMSGGGSSTNRIGRVHALILHELADDQVLVAVLAGDRKHAAREVLQRPCRQVLAHDDRGPVAVAEVHDPDLDALLAQLHRERRDHERRVEPSALQRLHDRRKVRKALRLEARGRLVFDAKSVTGHVRWQVTGRNPTASVSRAAAGGFRRRGAARCHGCSRSTARSATKARAPALQRTNGDDIALMLSSSPVRCSTSDSRPSR